MISELREFSAAAGLNPVVKNSIRFCATLPPRAPGCEAY